MDLALPAVPLRLTEGLTHPHLGPLCPGTSLANGLARMQDRGGEQVSVVMTTKVVVVAADAPVASAMAWASLHGAQHVIVVDQRYGRVLGIATTRDLTRADPDDLVASCIMAPVPCVAPEAAYLDAAAMMDACSVTALPVASGGQLLGVITADAVQEMIESRYASGPQCLNCAGEEDVSTDERLGIPLCGACRAQILWRSGVASC